MDWRSRNESQVLTDGWFAIVTKIPVTSVEVSRLTFVAMCDYARSFDAHQAGGPVYRPSVGVSESRLVLAYT